MAQSASIPSADVDHFVELCLGFIDAGTKYAEAGEYDAQTDATIRRITVAISAVSTVMSTLIVRRPIITPPEGTPNG
jgi:hypothetical protein